MKIYYIHFNDYHFIYTCNQDSCTRPHRQGRVWESHNPKNTTCHFDVSLIGSVSITCMAKFLTCDSTKMDLVAWLCLDLLGRYSSPPAYAFYAPQQYCHLNFTILACSWNTHKTLFLHTHCIHIGLPDFHSLNMGDFFSLRHAHQFVTLVHCNPVFSVHPVCLQSMSLQDLSTLIIQHEYVKEQLK